jgi:hypothetical protein
LSPTEVSWRQAAITQGDAHTASPFAYTVIDAESSPEEARRKFRKELQFDRTRRLFAAAEQTLVTAK